MSGDGAMEAGWYRRPSPTRRVGTFASATRCTHRHGVPPVSSRVRNDRGGHRGAVCSGIPEWPCSLGGVFEVDMGGKFGKDQTGAAGRALADSRPALQAPPLTSRPRPPVHPPS